MNTLTHSPKISLFEINYAQSKNRTVFFTFRTLVTDHNWVLFLSHRPQSGFSNVYSFVSVRPVSDRFHPDLQWHHLLFGIRFYCCVLFLGNDNLSEDILEKEINSHRVIVLSFNRFTHQPNFASCEPLRGTAHQTNFVTICTFFKKKKRYNTRYR